MINTRWRVIGGLFFFLLGILLIDTATPTGFVVAERASTTLSFVGVLLLLLGAALLPVYSADPRKRVQQIAHLYESGEIDVVTAAGEIDDAVGGIQRVRFSPGNVFTVYNERNGIPVPMKSRGEQSREASELAMALYEVGRLRHPRVRGELHLGQSASSKHHRAGLDLLLRQFEARHAKQLGTVRQRVA